MNVPSDTNTLFPLGDKAPSEHFTGTAYVKMLVSKDSGLNTGVGNVVFEPGCRNNWHSHQGGQILLCTAGKGYYQQRGNPIQLLHPGDVVAIPPNVVHWHGATPDSWFTHIAVGPNVALGAADWLEPVTDEEYSGLTAS